jgi:hypothetical protein
MSDGASAVGSRHTRTSAIHTAAALINDDVSAAHGVLAGLRPILDQYAESTVNRSGRRPMAARLLVARDIRRTVFITVSHRYAMALVPLTIEALARPVASPSALLDALATPAGPVLTGARGRVFSGPEAKLGALLRAVFGLGRQRMYEEFRPAEAEALRALVHELSLEVTARAAETHREEFGAAWHDPAAQLHPYRTGDDDRPYRSRTLAFLSTGLDPSLDVALRNSELGQAEHLAVAVVELAAAFRSAGCPVPERFGTALAGAAELGTIAALRDEVAERLLFTAGRTPPYTVVPVLGRWSVRPTGSPLLGPAGRSRPGRCPAVEALPPVTAGHRDRVSALIGRLAELTGGRTTFPGPAHLGISAADVCAVLALAVAYHPAVVDYGPHHGGHAPAHTWRRGDGVE